MRSIKQRFLEYLRASGRKVTRQRLAVLDAVLHGSEHFSAEELHQRLREGDRGISLATVYRTVGMMVAGGFLEALDAGGGQLLYEQVRDRRHHDHLVCMDCGRIEEFHCEDIERLQEEQAEAHDFLVTHHSLRLFGFCAACRCARGENSAGLKNQPAKG